MVGEETLLLCMGMALLAGLFLGFAIGYGLKERAHSKEIESIIRIAKRVSEAKHQQKNNVLPVGFCPQCGTIAVGAPQKERAPKGPIFPDHPNRQPC